MGKGRGGLQAQNLLVCPDPVTEIFPFSKCLAWQGNKGSNCGFGYRSGYSWIVFPKHLCRKSSAWYKQVLPPANRWYRYVPGATGQGLESISHHQLKQTVSWSKCYHCRRVPVVKQFGLHPCINSRVCQHHPAACMLPILQLFCASVVWNIVISLWMLLN